MSRFTVANPYHGQPLAELAYAEPAEIATALQNATLLFRKWGKSSSSFERSEILKNVSLALEARRDQFAMLICHEAGKPIAYALAEVERAIGVLRWASAEALRFTGELLNLDTAASGRAGFGIASRFPRGPVLGITPFNFPLNLVLHKIAPAVACGCPILIKPSPFTPLTALALAKLFSEQLPHLVQILLADAEATAKLTQAPEIATVSFTGSAPVGWQIRKQAPLKPTTLELGGNAWVIVTDDTLPEHFPKIINRIVGAAYGYAGQSCISVQNAAIAASRFEEFKTLLIEATENVAYGDPERKEVISGPVINTGAVSRIKNSLANLPKGSEKFTSRNLVGEAHPDSVLAPTLITVSEGEKGPIVQEEIFAPIMTLQRFTTLENLVTSVNSGHYGLQAGVYTQNLSTIQALYKKLDVGGVVVNDVPTTRYDHQPYGGQKDSGQGREGIRYAMEEMTEVKFLALSSQIL